MKFLNLLDDHIEDIFLVFTLATMSVIIFIQVVMRYIFKASLYWSEELARYLFIWMTYIGISFGVKKRRHIKVDFFISLFPRLIKKIILTISDITFLLFSIIVIKTSCETSTKILKLGQNSPALGIPMGYIYFAPAVGFTLVSIRLIQSLIERINLSREGA